MFYLLLHVALFLVFRCLYYTEYYTVQELYKSSPNCVGSVAFVLPSSLLEKFQGVKIFGARKWKTEQNVLFWCDAAFKFW